MNFFKLVFVIVLSIVILLSVFLVYLDSERTKVREIKISYNVAKPDKFLFSSISNLLEGKSIFSLDKILIEEKIKLFSDDIKDVNVIIYPPDSVYVSLVFREPVLKVFLGNSYIVYDEELREIINYDRESFEKAITLIPKRPIKKEFLQSIIDSVKNLDYEIRYSKYFPDVFILDKDGIYAFNSIFKINIYFGYSIDESKVKKAFLSTRYIVQKKLPVRYIDARFDNVIAN